MSSSSFSSSSSSAPPPWSWALVVCAVCSCVVGWVVVVLVMAVVGLVCCFESAAYKVVFQRVPFRAEPVRVAREIVVSVDSGWLQVCVDVIFPSHGRSSHSS